jgi:hypothetical protein
MKGRYRYRNKKNGDDKFRRTGQSTLLKSGYTVDQTRKGLKKAWLGYTIAKNKGEEDKMVYYASVIQKLQKELGYTTGIANFPHLDLDKDMANEKSSRKKNSENDNNHREKSRVHRPFTEEPQ